MASEEGIKYTSLVPSGLQLFAGVAEEAAYVSACERKTAYALIEDHGNGGFQMVPLGLIVASPHCSETLGAREEGAGEYKGTPWPFFLIVVIAMKERLIRGIVEGETIEVVNVAVLPVAKVQIVLGHGGFRAIEDGGLVHVVPDKGILGRAGEF